MRHHEPWRPLNSRFAPLFASAIGLSGVAFFSTAQAADFSGSLTATSDYVFRGVSQTQENPSLQLGAKLAFDSGFYLAGWVSNVDYGKAAGSDAEFDYVLGWNGTLTPDVNFDINLTRYTYPGTHTGYTFDYNELNGTLTWKNRWFGLIGYSNDAFASGKSGAYLQVSRKFPINDAWRVEAAVADYELDDTFADDYQHASVSLIYAYKKAEFRLTGHKTSDSAETLFGEVGDSRIEFATSVSF